MSGNDADELKELLDALRAEYEADASADELPPEALADCDEPTRRAVGWLRACWEAEQAEEAETAESLTPPVALARAARRRTKGQKTLGTNFRKASGFAIALAAAAALFFALRGPTDLETGPTSVDRDASAISAKLDDLPDEDPTAEPDYGADAFRSRDDGIELVHGTVRLVLLAQNKETHHTTQAK